MAVKPAWSESDIRDYLQKDRDVLIQQVIDGDTAILQTGEQVRLLGIQAPKLPLGRKNFVAWPLGEESKQALDQLITGKSATLYFGTVKQDRHNRILAHLFMNDGGWVQGQMIAAGMARAYSFPDNRLLARELQKLEQAARAQKRGIWNLDYYRIRDAANISSLQNDIGTFQLVEGVVKDVAEVKKTFYINFGQDWRTDFTAVVPFKSRRIFREDKIEIKKLAGRKIRVRGWIEDKNGPSIELSHPEQLEILN